MSLKQIISTITLVLFAQMIFAQNTKIAVIDFQPLGGTPRRGVEHMRRQIASHCRSPLSGADTAEIGPQGGL